MKKIIFSVLIVTMVLLQTTSCSDDYLKRPPLGIQSDKSFFNSPGAGFKTVVNCYLGFYNFWGYQAAMAELGNMATDDADKGGSDAGDRPFITDLGYGRALSNNETLANLWSACYSAIGNCNVGLDHMIDATNLKDKEGNPLDDETKKRYIAEIRFLRAFFYFDLVRVFGGVPLVTKTLPVEARDKLKRTSADSIFNFIEKEWTSIIPDLPTKKELPSNELGRVTQGTVRAMLARAYLFFADNEHNEFYAKARDAAKKVIDSKNYALTPNYQDLWLPNGYKTEEPVFMVIFGDNPSSFIYGSTIPIYCSPRSVGGWGFDCLTQSLVDEYETGDPRRLFTVLDDGDIFPKENGGKEVMDFSVSPNTGYYNRKEFLIDARRGQGWGSDAWTFYIMRYSDVLLMYAEALLHSGGSAQEVANYINKVRNRASNSSREDVEAIKRNAAIQNIPLPPVKPSDDLIAAIQHERRAEFGGEYQRLYDLIRWGIYVETMHEFSTKPYSNGKGAAFKKHGSGRYVFPIPQVEIDRSGGSIVQNPGY